MDEFIISQQREMDIDPPAAAAAPAVVHLSFLRFFFPFSGLCNTTTEVFAVFTIFDILMNASPAHTPSSLSMFLLIRKKKKSRNPLEKRTRTGSLIITSLGQGGTFN